jgi:hypothetical protein
MTAFGSFPKNTKKMNLRPILNKNSQDHIELEFDELGVDRKLVNYVVHSFKQGTQIANA